MKHPALSQVEAYWNALRGDRPAPLRSEVDPRGIDQALENAFILERIAPGVARFRLAGMHLNDLMGMEVRGMPVTSFFTPDSRRTIADALEHVFEQPARARFALAGEHRNGRNVLTAAMILLPLRSDLGDISRALGCFVSEGQVGRAPNRFTITQSDLSPLTAGPATGGRAAGRPPRHETADDGAHLAEAPARYGAADPATRRAHLRLVHDRDDAP